MSRDKEKSDMNNNISAINGMMGNTPARKAKQVYQFQQNETLKATDSVKISNDVMTVRGAEQLRLDKIMEVRQQIQDGTYLTEEKLDSALNLALDAALKNA